MNPSASDKRFCWLLALGVALATFLVYLPVRHHDFINFDDPLFVYENAQVRNGLTWEGVVWASTATVVSNWHPLTMLSHMLDVQLFGVNPGPHHLVSVFIHAANAVLLLLVLARLTGAPGRSALVAALFALHPTHVESVAWIAERKDVLSTLFWLLTMGAYLRYTERPSRSRYALVVVGFALGLMCKPMVVTLPFVLLLLDYWPLRRWQPRLASPSLSGQGGADAGSTPSPGDPSVAGEQEQGCASIPGSSTPSDSGAARLSLAQLAWEKWPLFALTAVSCLVTFLIQKQTAVISVEQLPLAMRITNALVSYGRYLQKTFWPVDLAIFYPYPEAWPFGLVVAVVLALAVMSFLTWRLADVRPYLLVGWLWYLGTLVPVIGIVQVGSQSMADRYTYIPLIGVFVLVVWGAADFADWWRSGRILFGFAALAVIAGCAVLTARQLAHWRNSETLFRHTLAVTRGNAMAHNSLGDALAARGKTDEALQHCLEAIRLKPTLAPAYNNAGTIWLAGGKSAEAVRCFQEAARLQPNNAQAHNNLGLAFASQGRMDEAQASYREALRLAPNYAQAHSNLGGVLLQLGQVGEAVVHLRAALQFNPGLAEAHYNLAIALAKQGKMPEAVASRAEAIRLNPRLGNEPNR